MPSFRDAVLAEAERELLKNHGLDKDRLLPLYKAFLVRQNERLLALHKEGCSGVDICHQRATVLDVILQHLLRTAPEIGIPVVGNKFRFALSAIGGYGRAELNPFSDIDIMFLHDGPKAVIESHLGPIVELVLYTLWDLGLKVGHSSRTIDEAVEQANADMLSKTSLLETRLVVGDEKLFEAFRKAFVDRCVKGFENEYIAQRVQNQTERHSKYGRTVYMQEPNIKNGCGGLRDYQNLLWISFFKERIQSTRELVEHKLINDSERRQLDEAYDFLLRIRNELHYLNSRPSDVILINQQLRIANTFAYTQKSIIRRTEALMRDYYQHARNIYNLTELMSERMSVLPKRIPKRTRLLRLFGIKRKTKRETFDGLYSEEGELFAESRAIYTQDPARLMRTFQTAQKRGEPLSAELKHLIRRRIHLVDRAFQYGKAQREIFLELLSRKGEVGHVLRSMHEVDLLGKYIPEFGELTCLVQHEFFHRYTADEHTLVCIEKLDELIDTNQPRLQEYKNLFQRLEDPTVLYLAILLHDTGKSANSRNHSDQSAIAAQRVAARLQLTSPQRKRLIFLVDHHITLSHTAQRRNLEDPSTIAEFAELVGSQTNLDNLMILTLVDGQGIGEETWSDWKESLVWQLYRGASLYLADNDAFYKNRRIERDIIIESVAKILPPDFVEEIDAHFQSMPERYLLAYTPAQIADHIRLFREFLSQREAFAPHSPEGARVDWIAKEDPKTTGHSIHAFGFSCRWIAHPNKGHSEFWFCGWDRHQLLAKVAGSLSAAGLNILGADAFTRGDSLVLDIFRVCDADLQAVTNAKSIAKASETLKLALDVESFDFQSILEKSFTKRGFQLSDEVEFPTRIVIDTSSHPAYTIVDLQTPDRLGLLHVVLDSISRLDLEIALSRIATEKGAAIDTFYLTDKSGEKVTSEESLRTLRDAILTAIESLKPIPTLS